MKKKVIIFGVSGSIGKQTIEVIRKNSHRFELVGISVKENVKILTDFAEEFKPPYLAIYEKKPLTLSYNPKIFYGREGLEELASIDSDLIVMAISGIEAIYPTKKAIEEEKDIAIATKEVIVSCGELIKEWLKKSKTKLIPIDSEHSTLFQLVNTFKKREIKNIFLTASGGPFWNKPKEYLENATLEDVLKHPTWNMGRKTTIDSANLINKGLEVIEAHFFFGFPYSAIKVLIHPQSIVHGLIELKDGSFIAHMAPTDMKIPIQYALSYPQRINNSFSFLSLSQKELQFYDVDLEKFPGLDLAYNVGSMGGVYPAIFAIGDEILVDLFLKGKIKFKEIIPLLENIIEDWKGPKDLEDLEMLEFLAKWVGEQVKKNKILKRREIYEKVEDGKEIRS